MKSEVRILASSCAGKVCSGFVLRGRGVDGVALGLGCAGLCLRLSEKGFLGELRYSVGDCSCGLPSPPRVTEASTLYLSFARKVSERVEELMERLSR